MRVLLTGATGFLGQHVVELLKGHHEVVALVRDAAAAAHLGVELRVGDLTDPETLAAAVEGCEVVVHAAGQVSHLQADAGKMWAQHVTGTEALLTAAKAAGVKRFVHLSSSGTLWVSEADSRPADEGRAARRSDTVMQLVAQWPYYRAKRIGEEAALASHEPGVFEVICLNPSLLLGPGDRPGGQSTAPVRLYLEGSVPLVPGGTLAFVDVRDVAWVVARSVDHGRGGEALLLSAASWTWREFYERVARMAGKPAPLAALPATGTRRLLGWLPTLGKAAGFGLDSRISREELELASHHWGVDASLAEERLGWRPRDPLDTLADTVEDLQRPPWQPWIEDATV